MCFIFPEHFSGFFLILCMIYYGPSPSTTIAYATSLNASEEIKSIFNHIDDTEPFLKGGHETGNFAEGGLIKVNLTQFPVTHTKNKLENKISHSKNSSAHEGKNNSFIIPTENSNNSSEKTLVPTKLTETGSNLFLGVPEVIHVSGTSSIKPRKGVYFNKIVPRKGVNENETELENQPCFQLNDNECYDAKEIHNLECSCCKEGNVLGKIVKKQKFVNCKNCKPINKFISGKQMCKNICCSSVLHDTHSTTTLESYNNYKNYKTVTSPQKKEENLFDVHISDRLEGSNDLPKVLTEVKDAFRISRKNFKLKPSVTKVPYDVEVMTELLSKAQKKVFVPVIVSIFLLPLIGVLLYFLWRRTKEYWDKMYYKRMDFLIDGIYND